MEILHDLLPPSPPNTVAVTFAIEVSHTINNRKYVDRCEIVFLCILVTKISEKFFVGDLDDAFKGLVIIEIIYMKKIQHWSRE